VWSCWQSEEARRANEPELDAEGCLNRLADLALGDRKGVSLRFQEQEDSSFMWKASSVHPLQVLENAYQRIVRKAGNQAPLDPVQAESETLARYFMQDAGEPACFVYKPGAQPGGSTCSGCSSDTRSNPISRSAKMSGSDLAAISPSFSTMATAVRWVGSLPG
jgi:hypothetical protein